MSSIQSIYPVLDGASPPAVRTLPSQLVDGVDWPYHLSTLLSGTTPVGWQGDSNGNGYVTAVFPATNIAPVTGAFTGTGDSSSFTPQAGRPFNISGWGTFSATVQLQRSFDEGSTWLPLTGGGFPIGTFTAAFSEQFVEYEAAVLYRLDCVYASGTVNYRISQ